MFVKSLNHSPISVMSGSNTNRYFSPYRKIYKMIPLSGGGARLTVSPITTHVLCGLPRPSFVRLSVVFPPNEIGSKTFRTAANHSCCSRKMNVSHDFSKLKLADSPRKSSQYTATVSNFIVYSVLNNAFCGITCFCLRFLRRIDLVGKKFINANTRTVVFV